MVRGNPLILFIIQFVMLLFFARPNFFSSMTVTGGFFQVEKRPDIDRFKSRVVFEDLGSSYGTYVGDAAIASSQTQVNISNLKIFSW